MYRSVKATSISDRLSLNPFLNPFPDAPRADRSFDESEAMAQLGRCTEDDRLLVLHVLFRTISAQERWEKRFKLHHRFLREESSSGLEDEDHDTVESTSPEYVWKIMWLTRCRMFQ